MTNLEFYKNEFIKRVRENGCFWGDVLEIRYGFVGCDKPCDECLKDGVDWLLKEHKESIKLKQWEYDLLLAYSCNSTAKFEDSSVLLKMKEKGNFKKITDTSMTLEEILNNCEVIE